jgi:hypothetical protein
MLQAGVEDFFHAAQLGSPHFLPFVEAAVD